MKGIKMAKTTVKNNETNINKLPNDKPVMYKTKTEGGTVNYVGVAQRGRVQERLKEHLPGGKEPVPGAKVQIEQVSGIAEAKKIEAAAIKTMQPKYNEQGK
jgi:excinuclease UvrABC nuclease subunit